MIVVRTIAELRAAVREARGHGQRVGFVPTMGALHAGHLSLLDRARATCECVVLSIFVNPLQFAPTEDLAKYPRTEASDLEAASARGTTIAFVPHADEMYPGPRSVSVEPHAIADRWEGAIRPGHFAGVLTVVAKLFNIVQPDVAVFGQKDLQQVTLISAMVRDLDVPVHIDVAPIVRERDGLAMSSRNRYLSDAERMAARALSASARDVAEAFARGERAGQALVSIGLARLHAEQRIAVDYLEIVSAASLEPMTTASPDDYVIIAARVGATRLLDNHRLGDTFPAVSA
jgi:pantoate--beta-alanine ligase